MQIQLKQTEIVTALKQFIARQGINLTGKSVDITFTAGRKESGISADIDIQDHDIPGYTDTPPEAGPAQLVLVPACPEKDIVPPSDGIRVSPDAIKPTTSLFN